VKIDALVRMLVIRIPPATAGIEVRGLKASIDTFVCDSGRAMPRPCRCVRVWRERRGDQSGLIGPRINFTKSLFEGCLSGRAALERLVCISIDQEQSRQIAT
jgi:hypothetical protein